jgi:hypothetical protein
MLNGQRRDVLALLLVLEGKYHHFVIIHKAGYRELSGVLELRKSGYITNL